MICRKIFCETGPTFGNPHFILHPFTTIPSFGIRIQSILDVSNILNDNVHATVIPQVPPWTMHHPKVCLDLSFGQERHSISCLHSKVQ